MSEISRSFSKVSEVMTRLPEVVSPEVPLNQAWSRMRSENLRHLPVVRDGKLIGVLSDRTLRLASAYEGSMSMKVEDAMVVDPFVVSPEAPLYEVCAQMATHRYGSVIVVDSGRKPLGIFTAQDALRVLSEMLKERREPVRKIA